jgi:LmbE family N-acetylglucosaminyl deacetylase
MVHLEEWARSTASQCMIELVFPSKKPEPVTILCLGAHSDDIEIGCGGALLYLKAALPQVRFHWVVFSAPGPRMQEATTAAGLFTAGCEKQVVIKDYRDGFLPYNGAEVKDCFEEIKVQVSPDLVFTHWQGDAHQDHRLLSELTWNTFRNHLILEYEIPKYDGDMGRPNLFIPLEGPILTQKMNYLFTAFGSQRSKPWFDCQLFTALMRIRGMESNSPSGYAEAFHCRKLVVH